MTQGGTLAELAWVRLAKYFSRFRLIPGLRCSLEVLAPTLSKVPIFIPSQTKTVVSLHLSSSSSSSLSNISQHEEEQNPLQKIARQQQNLNTPERNAIFLVTDCCHELLKSGTSTTIREVYYFYVTFFCNQNECNNAIRDLASCLSVSRSDLGLVASPNGWFCGCIDLYRQRENNSNNNGEMEGGQELVPILNGRELDMHGMPITLQLKTHIVQSPDAKCILVIEKEGIYLRLSQDKFFLQYYGCILVTGKGFPDLATRSWVQHLQQSLKLPVYGLCDCNPYGISVLQTFQYQGLASHRASTNNNKNNNTRNRHFDLKWMGLRPSQVEELNLPAGVYQQLTDLDKK